MFPADPVPEKIGTYKVLRRLSRTGSVETLLARAEGPMGFQRTSVLKLMADTSEGSAKFAEELAREAAICARMNHPSIVRMFDFFEHEKKLVLVLEHIEGPNLTELLEQLAEHRQRLGDPAVYFIGHEIAGALAHAHATLDEKGASTPVIHRNLHPDNILVGVDGQVRLTGFGVGKIVGRTPDTAIGTVKGRPGYMAPEQARGEPVTPKVDIYGLGLLLWSLFTGKRPPSDGTWPAKLGTLRADLPREIVAMVEAALERFPGTRKISAREIEQWLSKVVPAQKGKTELKERVAAYQEEHPPEEPEISAAAPPPAPPLAAPPQISVPSAIRFGTAPPPMAMPVSQPLPFASRRGDEWKQSIPDVESLDLLFDAAKAPSPAASPVAANPVAAKPASRPPAAAIRIPPPPGPIPLPALPAGPLPPPPPLAPAPSPIAAPVITLPAPAPAVIHDAPPPTAPSALVPGGAIRFEPTAAPKLGSSPGQLGGPSGATEVRVAVAPAEPLRFGAPPPVAPSVGGPPMSPGAAPQRVSATGGRLSTIRIGGRPLSTMGTVIVSAVTATIVVAVGLYVFSHRARPSPGGAASAAVTESSIDVPIPTPPPTDTAPANAVPSAAPLTAPAPSAAPDATPANLPVGKGYLVVKPASTAEVYVSGKLLGPAAQGLVVGCGRWYVRLATPGGGKFPEWVSAGQTVNVPCQGAITVEMKPAPPKR